MLNVDRNLLTSIYQCIPISEFASEVCVTVNLCVIIGTAFIYITSFHRNGFI